ncbi:MULTISPECIES: precorrin-6y C5,15-methyltransferase (decarboxylating) subunit CbiE [Pseudanabaena]|jgi:precorrin-6B C5,15-methyltransferase / cobalt-precorrin-6B C5,C15-methyltransferase|uniref:precorrin-6y C5,15-methyltransferase (decarboxylating) subunit CbiE n=1 Tax=Pseudanabaena TaxID=1152 RepID=UPI002478F7CF|nr:MULTISPECIES: precorrin-6y C5,15-methyltransferase (decarboxylating) subunit CbiE [Pseudanabaena]MEA5489052.1 precorrin-6y C5,15-methyltransferase (decarboxylating) subunit CbiE [Pseudanabaena sp. CCNP1317]WGS73110.1 precorrin-6y C5,15-methyltransferase (decarboxylating) subunit CbiE [Pseudanabaena galeata CCNP1313]
MTYKRWITVIGIGEDGVLGLSSVTRSLIDAAEILVGGDRHLAMLPELLEDQRSRIVWSSPIESTIEQIINLRGKSVCVLASGDPLWFGIGTTLLKRIPIEEIVIIPSPSTFSFICARLGWSLNEVETLSLCGRRASLLQAYIYPNAKLLILSSDKETPQTVVKTLCDRHFSNSKITILEHLNGSKERIISTVASQFENLPELADLNAIAVECIPSPNAKILSRMVGLSDDAFYHDGQLTKQEVRAITLSTLAPNAGELLWDVGAGCGSIGIEWMRSHPRCQAIAIEKSRTHFIAENAIALGTPNLKIIKGKAPEVLQGLPTPDAIFIGGGATVPELFETCWENLRSQGRLVANVVTLEGEQKLFQWQQKYGGTLTQISISRAEAIGSFLGWKPMRPVIQWLITKP